MTPSTGSGDVTQDDLDAAAASAWALGGQAGLRGFLDTRRGLAVRCPACDGTGNVPTGLSYNLTTTFHLSDDGRYMTGDLKEAVSSPVMGACQTCRMFGRVYVPTVGRGATVRLVDFAAILLPTP